MFIAQCRSLLPRMRDLTSRRRIEMDDDETKPASHKLKLGHPGPDLVTHIRRCGGWVGVITGPAIERCAAARLNMNARTRSMGPGMSMDPVYGTRGPLSSSACIGEGWWLYVWGDGQYLCGKETMECGGGRVPP